MKYAKIETFGTTYRYPVLENTPFQNPMVRWENIAFVSSFGGEILDTVIAGLKPYGTFINNEKTIDELKEKALSNGLDTWVKKGNENDVTYRFNAALNKPERYRKCELHVSQKGSLTKNFNLEALITTYDLYSKALKIEILSEKDKRNVMKVKDTKLIDAFKSFGIVDSTNPIWNIERVIVGLVFGYPIESTLIFIKQKII